MKSRPGGKERWTCVNKLSSCHRRACPLAVTVILDGIKRGFRAHLEMDIVIYSSIRYRQEPVFAHSFLESLISQRVLPTPALNQRNEAKAPVYLFVNLTALARSESCGREFWSTHPLSTSQRHQLGWLRRPCCIVILSSSKACLYSVLTTRQAKLDCRSGPSLIDGHLCPVRTNPRSPFTTYRDLVLEGSCQQDFPSSRLPWSCPSGSSWFVKLLEVLARVSKFHAVRSAVILAVNIHYKVKEFCPVGFPGKRFLGLSWS